MVSGELRFYIRIAPAIIKKCSTLLYSSDGSSCGALYTPNGGNRKSIQQHRSGLSLRNKNIIHPEKENQRLTHLFTAVGVPGGTVCYLPAVRRGNHLQQRDHRPGTEIPAELSHLHASQTWSYPAPSNTKQPRGKV